MPRVVTVLSVAAAEEEDMPEVIEVARRFSVRSNCQNWTLEVLNSLEARGLIVFDEAAWAAMEIHRQGP
ncbi:hypothetical protein N7456_003018 [Penicillium angulare]|uniref:Uncharacterized protein n=1 Tax=Penicillium angulare TaxID=116970 RepID=A0A9W9FTZ6_9EURO|nr:hypothetical protein N7456_003018 [Penicillium angulare]